MQYLIQPGDSLASISMNFGIDEDKLIAINPQLRTGDMIFPGEIINVFTAMAAPSIYTVQPGDTLYKIGQKFGISLNQLIAANPQIANPNSIFPAEVINIPSSAQLPGAIVYVIQPGDSLYAIARHFGTSVDEILRLNPNITNPNLVYPGQRIFVPSPPPGCVIYISTRSGISEVWRSDALGGGIIRLTNQSTQINNPQWAPNANYISYLAGNDLFISDPCGRNQRMLADNVMFYSWSHNSGMIAYSNENGTFIVNLQGETRKLAANLFNPVWFPDDNTIAGATLIEDLNYSVLGTIGINGMNFRAYLNPVVPAAFVKISPNGRYAATQILQGSPFSVTSIISVYDFSTNTLIALPGAEFELEPGVTRDISTLGGWSPDSSRLVYSSIVNPNGYGEIKIATPEGAIIKSYGRGFYPQPLWGPISDWIIYTLSMQPGRDVLNPTSPRNIYLRNIISDREIKVTTTGDNYSPDWIATPCLTCT